MLLKGYLRRFVMDAEDKSPQIKISVSSVADNSKHSPPNNLLPPIKPYLMKNLVHRQRTDLYYNSAGQGDQPE